MLQTFNSSSTMESYSDTDSGVFYSVELEPFISDNEKEDIVQKDLIDLYDTDETDSEVTESDSSTSYTDRNEETFLIWQHWQSTFKPSTEELITDYVDLITEQHMSLVPVLTARARKAKEAAEIRQSPCSPEYWRQKETEAKTIESKTTESEQEEEEEQPLGLRENGVGRMSRRCAQTYGYGVDAMKKLRQNALCNRDTTYNHSS